MDPETKNIWLDPEDRILPSIIHECLHILFPNLPPESEEKWILKLERKICRRITDVQMKNLLFIVAERLKKSKQNPKLKKISANIP